MTEEQKNKQGHSKADKNGLTIVGIGASAGGLEAYKQFFSNMPAKTGMAFVLIPHLDPGHKSLMVEIISRHTSMPAIQVEERMTIEPNHIYIVPPNRNLGIEQNELVPYEISRKKGINLPIDFFFGALATEFNERAIGVILSGTMSDGTMGLKSIKEHGGLLIAQSPETAQHDGMPQSAINTGMVDLILPIQEMPDAIIKFIAHPYVHGNKHVEDEDELNQILAVIHARSNHDFRCYKRNTLIRRTERRMGLRQIEKMADYLDILKTDPEEVDALLKDLLIGVTGFFREEQVWESLGGEILPLIMKQKDPDTPLRIWIPGCSTGEEAYTIAILVHDLFDRLNRPFNAQIFATDIDSEAIGKARLATYPESIAGNISPDYLQKYFTHDDHEYRVARKLRESVVFAVQNLISDAPFSNLDLISCRNLLIYLESDIQNKVMELFHFSLREGGYLVLGNSETTGYDKDLFETISKEYRIYRGAGRRDNRTRIPIITSMTRRNELMPGMRPGLPVKSSAQLMQTQLLSRFAPAAILINNKNEIVNFHGPTDKYLQMPQGDPNLDLMSLIREGLRVKMRAAVHKSIKNNESISVTDARVKREDQFYAVSFTVTPIKEKDVAEALFLITFEEKTTPEMEVIVPADIGEGEENVVRQLENELMHTREDLQNTIEELETTNEELKASNEEMMSMNEELQSSNEELETSKEELQSLNEELNTVNAELREKIDELESTNDDLVNLMNSTEVATIFLDMNTTIRRFTPAAKNLFNLIPSDIGRPIGDLSQRFSDEELAAHTHQVIETLAPTTKEVKTDGGQWFIRRLLPFRTQDNRVDGLVLTFSEVTEIKEKEKNLKNSEDLYRSLVEDQIELVSRVKPDGTILFANEGYCRYFGKSKEALLGYKWQPVAHSEDLLIIEEKLAQLSPDTPVVNIENRVSNYEGNLKWVQFSNKAFFNKEGAITEIQSVGRDITENKNAEESLQKAIAEKEVLLQEIHHRVKNNMQVISSLLSLKARMIDNEHAKEALNESQNRVYAMAALHEALYQSDNLVEIDAKEYLNTIIKSLKQTYIIDQNRINIIIEVDNILLNIDQVSPLGLAINEIVSNALKYAFPDSKSGEIHIRMKKRNDNELEIVITDNGVGIPDDLDWKNTKTVGFRLIRDLVNKQLNGDVKLVRGNGTQFNINFKID